MPKKLPIKYRSEDAVKRALKIDTFRNLSKDKIMQFASMIPYMDKDVAIATINQFPTYAEFGKNAISCYSQMCNKILEDNKESQTAAIHGYQTILDALSKRMDKVNSEEERKAITDDMLTVANHIAEIDYNNKKFLLKIAAGAGFVALGITAAIGAAIGVASSMSGSDDLPQLPEDENDEENDQ